MHNTFSSTYWRWQLDPGPPRQCVDLLCELLPHIDATSWPRRFMHGGVYVAGRPAAFDAVVAPPCRLEYYEPRYQIEQADTFFPSFTPNMVVYRDDDLGVVFKPAGLPTMAARDQVEFNLWRSLQDLFGVPVHLPSRLDVGVCGVVLCSFSARMNRHLQRAYERRRVMKSYLAEVCGDVPWTSREVHRKIARDPAHPVLRRCVGDEEKGEEAHTIFEKVASYRRDGEVRSLLRAHPMTGRTHQIRLHCQSEGFPIVGDPYYGGVESPELRLVSYEVGLFHPYRQTQLTWGIPRELQPGWIAYGED